MFPASSDLNIYRGDTYQWADEFADDSTDPATPMDLSGHTWLCQIRANQDRGALVATIEVDSTNAATGTIIRTLSAAESSKLTTQGGKATYYWDLQSTDSTGAVKTWLSGKVKVRGDLSDEEVVP